MKNIISICLAALISTQALSQEKTKSFPLYIDVAVLGLHAHDLADFDSFKNIDAQKTLQTAGQREDGLANLSTLFLDPEVYKKDYRGPELGGHDKNTIFSGIYNYSQSLNALYKTLLLQGYDQNEARRWVVHQYINDMKQSYERTVGEPAPTIAICEPMTEVDLIPVLLFHDFVPGAIPDTQTTGDFKGKRMLGLIPAGKIPEFQVIAQDSIILTQDENDSKLLDYTEMFTPIATFDGKYDPYILARHMLPIAYIFPESSQTDKIKWGKMEMSMGKEDVEPTPSDESERHTVKMGPIELQSPSMGSLADLDRIFVNLILKRNREEISAYKTYDEYLNVQNAPSLVNLLANATHESLFAEHAKKPFEKTTTAKMYKVTFAKSLCPDQWMPAIECIGDTNNDFCLQ